MPVDPRRAGGGSAEVRGAQRIADLERRLGQLERGSKGAVLATGIKEQTPSGGTQFLTTSLADVSNCSVSLTAQVPTIAIVAFTGRVFISYSALQDASVYLNIDGVDVSEPYAVFRGSNTAGTTYAGCNIAHTWRVSLAAGTHTVKLRANHSAAAAGGSIYGAALTYIQTRA